MMRLLERSGKMRAKLEHKMINDLLSVLSKCNIIDSSKVTKEQLNSKDTIIAWNELLDNSKGSNKDSYLVYTIQDYQDNYFGDGEAVLAELTCILDLYTNYPNMSRKSIDLRTNLEAAFDSTWRIAFNLHEYDNQTKLHHYSYSVSKIYG